MLELIKVNLSRVFTANLQTVISTFTLSHVTLATQDPQLFLGGL